MNSDQDKLREILAATDHPPVRLLGGTMQRVSATQALCMLKSGSYEWCGSKTKVRKIRLVERRRSLWISCFRTTESATLQPGVGFHMRLRSA